MQFLIKNLKILRIFQLFSKEFTPIFLIQYLIIELFCESSYLYVIFKGESTNLTTVIRKNRGKIVTKRCKIGHEDWILRKNNSNHIKYDISEAEKIDEVKKICLKLFKTLKDMLL